MHGGFNKDSRAAQAHLALVRERRADRLADRVLEVAVREDHGRVLPAELERELLEARGRRGVLPCHFRAIQISDEAIVVGHREVQGVQPGRIGHGEGDPQVGGSIDVHHDRAQIGGDDGLPAASGGEDGQSAVGGVPDQLEKTGKTGVGALGGGQLDFIASSILKIGQHNSVVARGQAAGDQRIGRCPQACD